MFAESRTHIIKLGRDSLSVHQLRISLHTISSSSEFGMIPYIPGKSSKSYVVSDICILPICFSTVTPG